MVEIKEADPDRFDGLLDGRHRVGLRHGGVLVNRKLVIESERIAWLDAGHNRRATTLKARIEPSNEVTICVPLTVVVIVWRHLVDLKEVSVESR